MGKIIALIVVIAVSAYLSLSPGISLEQGKDKIAHFLFYAAATVFIYKFMKEYSLSIISIVAAVLEYLQRFVPNRQSSIMDLVFSLLGVASGFFIAAIFDKKEEEP